MSRSFAFVFPFALAFVFAFVFPFAFGLLSATAALLDLRTIARRCCAEPKTRLESTLAPSSKIHIFHFDVAQVWNKH